MPGVFLNEDDYNFDIALRRFKKQVEKAGVLSEMKKRQHYEKPSVMRKKKKAAARKRLMKKMRKNNKGFTLVELIIVVAIIAVLSAVVAPQYLKYVEKSKISTDMDTAAAIEQAVNVLCADGTIAASATEVTYVTWDVDGNGLSGTGETNVEAITGNIGKAVSNKAVDVAFKVKWASDGTPTVTADPDYTTWDDPAAAGS